MNRRSKKKVMRAEIEWMGIPNSQCIRTSPIIIKVHFLLDNKLIAFSVWQVLKYAYRAKQFLALWTKFPLMNHRRHVVLERKGGGEVGETGLKFQTNFFLLKILN